MVAFARNTDVAASVRLGNRVAARTRNGVFRNGKYEGRLVKTESLPSVPDAAKVKVENVYDYQGRRVAKVVPQWGGGQWVPTATNQFVYDGWLLVRQRSTSSGSTTTNSYVWGLDLSGSRQRAGGIGGLLAMVSAGSTNVYAYDGNGNVMDLIDASGGSVSATYEYGPFGEKLKADGTAASDNPFRFSTKFEDESRLLYYGFRYYDPERGRWVNRDPIGERGGLAIYVFGANAAVNNVDALGEAVNDVETVVSPPNDDLGGNGDKRRVFILYHQRQTSGKVVRKVLEVAENEAELILTQPERFGIKVSDLDPCCSPGQRVLAHKKGQFSPASRLPEGAKNIQGRPVEIDLQKFKAAGGKVHEYADIVADLEKMVMERPGLRSAVDAWKRNQPRLEGELLLEGDIPSDAIKGISSNARTCAKTAGRAFALIGFGFTAYDVANAAIESIDSGSPAPIAAEGIRQIGGWGGAVVGAKFGAVAGGALGIETGPGAIVTSAIGALVGGFAGFTGADWVADLVDEN